MIKQVCTRCVMDNTSDKTINFQNDGTCNYCNYSLMRKDDFYFPNEKGNNKLNEMIRLLKKDGVGKEYDCMMGISGGLDSSYLAYLGAKEWGLRILAVHIDDGFDTLIAKKNITNICNKYNIKLIDESPNSEEYFDLIKSFIKSGVPGIAIPQDNVLQAYLNFYAKKYNIKYFLSGANFSLESILERGDEPPAADGRHLKAIQKQFGEVKLKSLQTISLFERYISQKFISKIVTIKPLDFIEYNRENAINELKENADFNYYGGKHYESVYTKFVQAYYLPKKFNKDKRKSHYSSLIITNQMTREEALIKLKEPLYDEATMESEINFILNKIKMDKKEFMEIMKKPGHFHTEYKTSKLNNFKKQATKFRKILGE
ncbi:hypothetical protein AUO94_04085 [Planococcus kocurii]|uniref:N-acetyl sugar amidotransferase n=1 Tax=Planococcus kocurii TaxID=1374 RepID=A0ABM5WU50_9BACL|nr:N-acetyl sugar amidotransferase [Planococcus kocurii]ALS77876.1 hypothetical protein AUO94_04085 [Planococcus kocurii]